MSSDPDWCVLVKVDTIGQSHILETPLRPADHAKIRGVRAAEALTVNFFVKLLKKTKGHSSILSCIRAFEGVPEDTTFFGFCKRKGRRPRSYYRVYAPLYTEALRRYWRETPWARV